MANRKEILFQTLRHEKPEQTPWVPFTGVHAGRIAGYTATEQLSDGDKLYNSLMKVKDLYKPFGVPIIFDLQVEAECLGCELAWADDCPPSVAEHPLEGEDELVVPADRHIPAKTEGRIPMITSVMQRVKKEIGDEVALYGLICGPFTLATHLRGNDIFMDMYDDEDAVMDFLDYTAEIARTMADYYIEAGCDVIAVVDPLISQISAAFFEQFMNKPFTGIFDHIRAKGAFSSFFVCGDATRNIEGMCKTGPDAISVDENVNILEAKKISDSYNVCICGNIPLTTIMLHGNQQDNMKFAVDLLDSIEDKTNFILSPGCDMPYDVPEENAIGIAQAVLETDTVREMVKNYVAEDIDIEVELPDYEHLERPFVEVFTLDSATCAACQYMMAAANEAKDSFGDKIDLIEYKFTQLENIARCKKMGVPNLPSLYINGELKFRSLVPSKEELYAEIEKAMK